MKCKVFKITNTLDRFTSWVSPNDSDISSLDKFFENSVRGDYIIVSLEETPLVGAGFDAEDLNLESESEFVLETGSYKINYEAEADKHAEAIWTNASGSLNPKAQFPKSDFYQYQQYIGSFNHTTGADPSKIYKVTATSYGS